MASPSSKCFTTVALLVAILSFACVSSVLAARQLNGMSMIERHQKWMAQYGRVYKDDAEKAQRFEIFRSNVQLIESFNAGDHKFWLAANQFADLTNDEFKAIKTGFKPSRASKMMGAMEFKYENVSLDAIPATMDWRTKGAVTPVKDQGQCGCCWAFSTVAAMEAVVKLSTGKLVSLSEQELVDCDVHGEDQGCGGGLMDNAFQFIIKNGGLTTEGNYPYMASDGKCNSAKAANIAASIKGYEDVPSNNEAALMKSVANQPVSVAVDGGDFTFQFYSGGVMSGSCGTDLDHAITAIGYGTTSNGTKYWLMKNSWGTTWGENGYVRMEKDIADKEGMCGLAMQPSYPTK